MAAASAFPPVDTGAMASAASDLTAISAQMSDTGTQVSVLRDAVAGSEQWQGSASGKWQTVVTGRVSDASLSSEVVSKAASLLQQLAADLETEQTYYNKVAAELDSVAAAGDSRFSTLPPDSEAPYIAAMNGAVTRATNLLNNAGNDFLTLAALADGITAKGAANRMPGTPVGAKAPSLTVLATLMGTAIGDGHDFEAKVLSELGLTKNEVRLRPASGELNPLSGQPMGTVPDAKGDDYFVEVKDALTVSSTAQIRAQLRLAEESGNPLWLVISDKTANSSMGVAPGTVQQVEETGGAVVIRTGPDTWVNYSTGERLTPVRNTEGGVDSFKFVPSGSSGPADPGAPTAPVKTDPGLAAPAPDPVEPPVGPGDNPIVDPLVDPMP